MSDLVYRTKTYIAAAWEEDEDVIKQLYDWKDRKKLIFSFSDAHEINSSKDTSLKCSIKKSLRERLKYTKTFVLIVSDKTTTVRNGSCAYCSSYIQSHCCPSGNTLDFRSFIEYECSTAVEMKIKIVVLYNSTRVNKANCPYVLKDIGTHVAMINKDSGKLDYETIKHAVMEK